MAGNATRSEASQSFFIYVKDANTGIVKRVAIPGDVQVGLEGRPSELQLFGRLSVSTTTTVVDSANKGNINISNNDTIVALSLSVTPTSGRIKAYLPPTPREGQLHFIKDTSGTADTVPIDIVPASGVLIDGQASQTLSDAFGSLALVWIGGQWRRLVAGLGPSGGSGASTNASYVTINGESSLTNERHLTGSANLVMTDNGANASVYLDLTPVLGSDAGTYAAPTLTVDPWGRITSIVAGSVGAPSNVSYITVANEPSLTAERRLTGSFGVKLVDNGANSSIVASFDPTLLIAGGNLVISASGGNLTLSDFDPWIDLGNKAYTTGSVVSVGGFTGSLTQTTAGLSYLVAGTNVTISSQSNGQVVISSAGGGSSGGSLPLVNNLTIIAGSQVVDQVVFQAIGAFEFNPSGSESMAPAGSTSYTAYFQPIVEVFPTGVTLETQLYNVGLNSYVAASLLSCSQLGATRLRSPNLSGSLAFGSNTYEMHMRITNANAGKAICKGAKLFVTWT